MRYKEFFQIAIDHQYFPDGLTNLILLPDENTVKFLERRSFVIRRTAQGLQVLVQVDEDGNMLPTTSPDEVLAFNVFPTCGDFREFTDLPTVGDDKVLLFTNAGLTGDTTELKVGETTAGGVFNGFPTIAKIQIHLTEVSFGTSDFGPVYQTVFKSKSVKWKYYFVSNPESAGFVVEDRGKRMLFSEIDIGGDTADQIATSLKLNFPDAGLIAFESNSPITYSKKAIKNIQLLQNSNVIIKHLPNPDVGDNGIQIIKIK